MLTSRSVRAISTTRRSQYWKIFLVPLAGLILLASCGAKPAATLPERVGEWTVGTSETVSDVPPVLKQLGHRSTKAYQYQGPVPIRVVAHEMSSETVAFEAIQKWVAEPGTLPLQRKQFLLVPASPDKAALARFTQALAASF